MLWRKTGDAIEVLIGHPGGPFWAKRHEGAWSIPKGEVEPDEDPLTAARREFAEETGTHLAPDAQALDLGATRLKSGKRILGWAITGDLDPASLNSNVIEIEFPPRSGRRLEIPEVDEIRWCEPDDARRLLNPAQAVFVDRLLDALRRGPEGTASAE